MKVKEYSDFPRNGPKMPPLKDRLLVFCDGHPFARIPWPHRILHETIATLKEKDRIINILIQERDLQSAVVCVLESMVRDEVEYMTTNKLGDPEKTTQYKMGQESIERTKGFLPNTVMEKLFVLL